MTSSIAGSEPHASDLNCMRIMRMLTDFRQRVGTAKAGNARMSENQGAPALVIPEAAAFLKGAAAGELRIPRCNRCKSTYFPPRPFCPDCGSQDVEHVRASGRATLYSYIISHVPTPGFEPPFAIAVVELEEGARMTTNIVNCDPTPEALALDMDLEVTFEPRGGVPMPCFRPVVS